MKIGFASADWAVNAPGPDGRPTMGGSGWARCGLPAQHLALLGLDVVVGTLVWSKGHKVFGVREWPAYPELHVPGAEEATFHWDVDLIVLQRWMFASVAEETITARMSGQVVVNDVDDHFWALDPSNRALLATDPLRNPLENRDHYLRAIRRSSAVTVSTPYLADELRRKGVNNIHVLENRVDVEAWRTWALGRRSAAPALWGRQPVIGWVGATPWRSGDLETLRGVLGPFLVKHGLRAYHGGHLARPSVPTFAEQTQVDPQLVTTRGMAPIHEYPQLFDGLDIGLVPLRDVPFNRAKSWIKGLEYAVSGVPFVAASTPEYRRLHDEHGIGRVARKPKDWVRHLIELLDPDTREQEAAANAEAVEALDIRRGIRQWRDLYLDLLTR